MAKYEEGFPLDYRQGGDTVDDFAQKYMSEMARIYQFLNNVRTNDSKGVNVVEPEPGQFKVEDNKLYIRNGENTDWLFLFDIKFRMGITDNSQAAILTTDNVTTTAEALKLVQTNADGKVDVDSTGNANTATKLQTVRTFIIRDAAGNHETDPIAFDGSADVVITLPSEVEGKFKGDFSGTFTGEADDYIKKETIEKVDTGNIVHTPNMLTVIDANGLLPVDIAGNAGKLAGINVAIANPEDGQVLSFRAASRTWTNEARAVVGEGKALTIYDGDTMLVEYAGGQQESIDLHTTEIKEKITNDISTHNTASDAHADIRQAIEDIDVSQDIQKHNTDSTAHADKFTQYLPLTGGNITGALSLNNKFVAVSVNGKKADAEGNIDMSGSEGTQLYTSAGSYTWTVPDGISKVLVTASAGGGGGGYGRRNFSRDGYFEYGGYGGRGANCYKYEIAVTAGEEISIVIGNGGGPASAGGATSFGDKLTLSGGGAGGNSSGEGHPGANAGAASPQSIFTSCPYSAYGAGGNRGGSGGATDISPGAGTRGMMLLEWSWLS